MDVMVGLLDGGHSRMATQMKGTTWTASQQDEARQWQLLLLNRAGEWEER